MKKLRISEKNQVIFKFNDPIFELREQLPEADWE
jgi:hypothetical protein